MSSKKPALDKEEIVSRISILLTGLLLFIAAGCQVQPQGVTSLTDNTATGNLTQQAGSSPVTNQKIEEETGSFVQLAKDLKPAVVYLEVAKAVRMPMSHPFMMFQGPQTQVQRGQGTGFLISDDGYIASNNHVVQGADLIRVHLADGRQFEGNVVGVDPLTDVALVKINVDESLPYVSFGDSDKIEVGSWLMAIGSPFGLEATVTVGVLSAKGRVIGAGPYDDFLQTDASINPGNSGGPLFNINGEVIGINTAIVKDGTGIGFAIPSNLAKDIIEQLRNSGTVSRGFLGIQMTNVSPQRRQQLGLPEGIKGAIVVNILPGTPASQSDIQPGDVITEFNNTKISNDRELLAEVGKAPVDQPVTLKIYRDGSQIDVQTKLMVRPKNPNQMSNRSSWTPSRTSPKSNIQNPKLGIEVREISPALAQELHLTIPKGVIVTKVHPGGVAAAAGVKERDIIVEINGHIVKDLNDFTTMLEQDEIIAKVLRDGNLIDLSI